MKNKSIILVEEEHAKSQPIPSHLHLKANKTKVVALPDMMFLMFVFHNNDLNKLEETVLKVSSYYPVTYPYHTIWFDGQFKWENSYVITEDTFHIPLDTFSEHDYLYGLKWLHPQLLKEPFDFFYPIQFEVK